MLKGPGKQSPENQSPRSPFCGEPAALVSYLYNDGAAGELAAIAAHVQECESCTRELASLGDTRERLAAWSPPPTELGFTINASPASVNADSIVLSPSMAAPTIPWWRQATPVWMQAVAASAVFAAGLVVGASGRNVTPAPATTASTGTAASGTAVPVSRGELADLEQRLRAELTRLSASTPAPVPAPVQTASRSDDDALLKRMKSMVTESEERQQRELALRTTQVMRDFEIQRKVDLATVQQNIGQLQGATGAELRQQRELYNQLMNNVGLRSPGR